MLNLESPQLPPQDEADLVALADDCLPPARRAEVEARVAAEPALAAALKRQRAALALIAQLDTRAPLELRLRVEELKASHVKRRRRRRRWVPVTALGFAAVAAALLVLVAGGGPAVDDALAVALRPATAPAVAGDHVDGAWFPRSAKYPAVGARTDVVEGRTMRTVFYAHEGRTIAYTIVDGAPLTSEGSLRVLGGPGGRAAVTWTNSGHTCVISGSGVDTAALRELAAWH
jgi:anti-sigma factor RsiW